MGRLRAEGTWFDPNIHNLPVDMSYAATSTTLNVIPCNTLFSTRFCLTSLTSLTLKTKICLLKTQLKKRREIAGPHGTLLFTQKGPKIACPPDCCVSIPGVQWEHINTCDY